MDTGVALITLNAGMSGNKARPWYPVAKTWFDLYREFARTAASCIFPIIFGLFRFTVLSSMDYSDHPSEYGVHWNFYTTIGVISLGQNFFYQPKYALGMGVVILILY